MSDSGAETLSIQVQLPVWPTSAAVVEVFTFAAPF